MLIYKWSPGTGDHKNKLRQNYVLEININHCSRWTQERSFAACLLKHIHKPRHCLLSNLTSQVLFLLQYVSFAAIKIWSPLLIYTRAILPPPGTAKNPAETGVPICTLHNQCARKRPWRKTQLRLTPVNWGMHKVNKAKQKPPDENYAATSRQALTTVKKEFGFRGPRLCEII